MHSRFRMKGVLLAALVAIVASVALPGAASAEPQPGAKKKGFRLFARALGAMTTNRVYCGLAADGRVCVDSTNSSTIGGGFWPKGTADQYVFNSGLQLAGIISNPGGVWDGDTVGGFFFDPKGTTEHGEQVQPLYNSAQLDRTGADADGNIWPEAACVPGSALATAGNADADAALFDPLLQTGQDAQIAPNCRIQASQGDVWFMSWEGNPNLTAGRRHPLGVAVETRGMGWNYPSGNEDIIYFIYSFYNITSKNRADYDSIRPALADILHAKALDFHAANLARGVDLPDGGYTINNLFAAFSADMDVAEAGSNYSGVNLPFALGQTYDHTFSQPEGWTFDPSIFSPPFFSGAGFVGVKYLKSPTGAGAIQLFGNTINGGAFNDARDVVQLYRYLSGSISQAAGDAPCNTGDPTVTNICYVNNSSPADMRFFQSSTPLSLRPGGRGSIVVAYIFAAPVATSVCPGPACDLRPGDGRLLTDPFGLTAGTVNEVDRVSGFLSYTDGNSDNIVTQDEFSVVPGSLLGKALTAQAVFDAKFLLPFAPASPEFFLIPGDNAVTVLWKPSQSEIDGDPYFNIASAATVGINANPLYDPNYRQFDVEGYRVYRGRVDAPNELTLLAQFDYSGTIISDYTGIINPSVLCAPEFSIGTGGPDCPAAFPAGGNQKDGTTLTAHVDYDLVGNVIQLQAGKGRVPLADGTVFTTKADTAVVGGGTLGSCGPRSACPALANDGVPFVYVDATPRNNFRYFYSVTAFDVNSVESGPTSLESPRNTKPVTPVRPASNYDNVGILETHVVGRGVRMDSVFPSLPTIDGTTGIFSGPMPPANGTVLGFVGQFARQVIAAPGSLLLTLDSIGAGSAYDNAPTTYYFTAASGANSLQLTVPIVQDQFNSTHSGGALFDAVKIDDALAQRYGGDSSYALKAQAAVDLAGNYYTNSWGRGCVNGAPGFTANCDYNGSRWFMGPSPANNETKADPVAGNGQNFTPGVVDSLAGNSAWNNAGELTGVTVIHQPYSYQTMGNQWRDVEGVLGSYKRAADYNVYWNAGTAGLIDSVIDVTHNVVVPFDSLFAGATFGILTNALAQPSGVGQGYDQRAELSLTDFGCVAPFRDFTAPQSRIACGTAAGGDGPVYGMTRQAAVGAIVQFTGTPSQVRTSIYTGTGFALYMPGNIHIFETATLPQGVVWSLRDYVGAVRGGNGFGGNDGAYSFYSAIPRPFSAVGASISVDFNVTNAVRAPTTADLRKVHTVPDPYYVTNGYEQSTDNKVIKFVNLPRTAIVRIYSSSGVLVNVLEHNSTTFGGEMTWNVRNRNNQVVASGVYFYHIESNDASGTAKRVGRMTIVNFAQ